jgi:hypothetical protein
MSQGPSIPLLKASVAVPDRNGPMVGARISKDWQKQIKVWAGEQQDGPPLAPVIRRLLKSG